MKKIIFKYDLEKDLKNYRDNFLEQKYPNYGREDLNLQSLVSAINDKRRLEQAEDKTEYIRAELEKFYNKNKSYIEDQLVVLQKEWEKRGSEYAKGLEEYFDVKIDFEATCYLTTLGIAPYNYKQKYFYAMMTTPICRQLTTVAHEYMHLVFRSDFDEILEARGVDKQGILEINEALSILINFKFFNLFIVPDYNNKPSIQDLKSEVIRMVKEKKAFQEILDRLIEMRTGI